MPSKQAGKSKGHAAKSKEQPGEPKGEGVPVFSRVGQLCCRLALTYLAVSLMLLLRQRYASARPPEQDPRAALAQGAACDAADGSCSAGPRQWWVEADSGLSGKQVLHIDTLNFNSTVVGETSRPLLIAFYDPRSQSFKELKQELQETADALSKHEAAGEPTGRLGFCDVTVNTYLGYEEAPELSSGWQEVRQAAFKFGQPRFFPLIVILYTGGSRVGEYTGVVSAKHITAFLQRHSAVRGGAAVADAAAMRQLLGGPGPFVFGCGLEDSSAEYGAFNGTAHELHGDLIFGWAPKGACEEVLGALPTAWPQVVWVDGGSLGRVRSITDAAQLGNTSRMVEWLVSQRPELLEEMTPDTSHKYLDRAEPLLIFLVAPGDKAGWDRGVSLLGSLEHTLADKVQLVWSDCNVFGSQFGARKECPVFVAVQTMDMAWRKMPLKSLEPQQGAKAAQNSSARLLAWLENVTGIQMDGRRSPAAAADAAAKPQSGGKAGDAAPREKKRRKASNATRSPSAKKKAPNTTSGGSPAPPPETDAAAVVNATEKVVKGLTEGVEEDFLDAMPEIDSSADLYFVWTHYQSALRQLEQLQVSYEARYGESLPFDFSDLQRAQNLHPSMQSLATSPASVQRMVQDPKKLRQLMLSIEWQAGFELNASKAGAYVHDKRNLGRKMRQGYELVRGVFLRLFRHLHRHAEAGTMGIQEAKEQAVERRAASELSYKEFIERYAKPGRPVIITGASITEEEPWTMDFFRRKCNVTTRLQRRNALKWSWGRLEDAGFLPLPEFLDTFRSNATRRSWYLHDWSLPKFCPEVFGPPPYRGYTVPKYFAGDYFQRAAFDGYQHSWPSLFVGSEETQSAMHIDSGGTNFWLFLLSGRKEWRFFSRKDLVNIYQNPLHPHFLVDIFEPNITKFPLLRYAEMFVGVQEPGEIMFIPGGNPHAVRNLEPIHGISMNYVDASNVWIYLWHMLAENNFRSFEMFTDGITIPHGLRSDQQPMRFGEWKSTKWRDLAYDLH